tara:strand:- start:37 stop:759 length:723 start_codon:yes stop_codon:yes gene_type:complete
MATTIATLTLSSTDLLSDELALSSSATLTAAGTSTGVTQCTGLSRKTLTYGSAAAIVHTALYRAGDYTADKANKVYIKNTSTTAAEYFTIKIGDEELGRLYAGDWCFFPWAATAGTKESFVVTVGGTVAAGDSWEFDGITTTSADSTLNNFAAAISAQVYPNWTTTVNNAVVTFTARYAASDGVVTSSTAITGDVITDLSGSDLTMAITSGITGTSSAVDISIIPSVHTGMTYETMLIHE